jgi:hypothetical protein
MFYTVGTKNQLNREIWLKETLKKMPSGSRILDAGAGESRYKKFRTYLNYVYQDFAQYNGIFFECLAQELRRLPSVEKDYTNGAVNFGLFDYIAKRCLLLTLERSSKNDHGIKRSPKFWFSCACIKRKVDSQ